MLKSVYCNHEARDPRTEDPSPESVKYQLESSSDILSQSPNLVEHFEKVDIANGGLSGTSDDTSIVTDGGN